MVRRYHEPVRVRVADPAPVGVPGPTTDPLADPAPVAFVWRGRRYAVEAVQARWRERRAWWRDVGEEGPADETERVIWRVEARAGGRVGVFELGADGGSRWLLLRALD